jgi:hypothetical protein
MVQRDEYWFKFQETILFKHIGEVEQVYTAGIYQLQLQYTEEFGQPFICLSVVSCVPHRFALWQLLECSLNYMSLVDYVLWIFLSLV